MVAASGQHPGDTADYYRLLLLTADCQRNPFADRD